MIAAVPAATPSAAARCAAPRTNACRARRVAQPLRHVPRALRPAAAGGRLRLAPCAAAGRLGVGFGASAAVAEKTVDVPLNYYKVLGVDLSASPAAIERAHAKLSELPVDSSYSAAVQPARQAVLDLVLADLTGGRRVSYNRELRAQRASGGAGPPVPLPPLQAVGALALLAESGEAAEEALTLARDLVASGLLRPSALRDVRLAAALARADLARAAAARGEPARACAELRAASAELAAALGSPALAPQLRAACADSLAALLPAAALEQLAAPLGADAAPRRQAALATLAPLLNGSSSVPGALGVGDVEARLLPALTAAEAAALLDWADVARAGPAGRWAPLLRSGVRACLAAALSAREPRLARAAAAAARAAAVQGGAWAEEAAAAAMLLADPEAALELLSTAERAGDTAPMATVRGAAAAAAADEGGSPLPGLVAWAEQWLSDAALDSFRDTAGVDARLAPYYDEPRVARELQGGVATRAVRALGSAFGWMGSRSRGAVHKPPSPAALPPPAADATPKPHRLSAAARAAAAVSADKAPVAVTELAQPADGRRPSWREVPEGPMSPTAEQPAARERLPALPPPTPRASPPPMPMPMPVIADAAEVSEIPASMLQRAPSPPAAAVGDADAPKAPMSYAELMRRKQQQKAAGGAAGGAAAVPVRPRVVASSDERAPPTLPAQRVRRPAVDVPAEENVQPRALPPRPAAPTAAPVLGADTILFTAEQLSRSTRARAVLDAAEATIAASAAAQAAPAAPKPASKLQPAAAWAPPAEREEAPNKRAAARAPRVSRAPPPPPPAAAAPAAASSGFVRRFTFQTVPNTALAVAAGALALFFAARAMRISAALPPPVPVATAAVAASRPAAAAAGQRHSGYSSVSSAREAERVVRAWQRAKAVAMGSAHDAASLKSVLQGAMLDEWVSRAGRAHATGFHWRYTLRRVTVDRLVGGTPAGAPAAAEVTLRESAELVDARTGKKRDSYDATYKVRYLMEDRGEGYRISRAAVLENTEH